MASNRAVIVTGAVVIAAGIAWFMMQGKTTTPGAEGTIGAANRYQAGQISSEDVKLTDPSIQAFLQSDAFHKIQTNPELAQALASEQFQQALKLEAFQTAMAEMSQGGRVATDSEAKRGRMAPENNPGGRVSADYEAKRGIAPEKSPGGRMVAPASAPGGRQISPNSMPNQGRRFVFPETVSPRKFMANYQDLRRRMPANVWVVLAQNKSFRKLIMSKDLMAVVSADGFAQTMDALNQARTDAVAKGGAELANFNVAEALAATADGQALQKNEKWDALMADAGAREVIESAEFAQFFASKANADFAISTAELATNAELWSFLNSANMAQALSNEAVATIVADGSLFKLMNSPDGMAVLTNAALYQIGSNDAAASQVFGDLAKGVVTP